MDYILHIIQPLIIFAIVISAIVFFHELGHFTIARLCGVKVEEFAIGFGRAIFSWRHGGTKWIIGWLPLGGYVKMFGDADPASFPDEKKLQNLSEEELQQAFYAKPLWQKALIVFAGPAANYILAIAIFTALLMLYGQVVFSTVIGEVVPNSPAQLAGIQQGDIVRKLNGIEVNSLNEVKLILSANVGEPVDLVLERDHHEYAVTLTPEMQDLADGGGGRKVKIAMIGIKAGQYTIRAYKLPEALRMACWQSYQMSALILKSIKQFVSGTRSTSELGGPLTIADTSNRSYDEAGIGGLMMFIAMLSLNLGLINLLPIPMLDGGHLMFYAIHAMRGRPVAISVMANASRLGMILLLALMLFVISNDIIQYVFG